MEIPSEAEFQSKYLIEGKFDESWLPEEVNREFFEETITFLKKEKDDVIPWIKKRVGTTGTPSFRHFNRKVSDNNAERLELIKTLDGKSYEAFLHQADPTKKTLNRTSLNFVWENRNYQIEQYQFEDKYVGILRCFSDNKTDIPIPDFIKTSKDISNDPQYFFYNLADPAFSN